jgi:hypothetical protein
MHSKPAYDITQDLGTPGCWFHKRGSTGCYATVIQVLLASCIKGLPKSQKSILQDCVHYSKRHAALVLSWPSSGHRNVASRNESRRGCSTLSVSLKHHFSTGEKTERAKWCNWPTKIGTSTRNYGTSRSLDSCDAPQESTSHSSRHYRGDTW